MVLKCDDCNYSARNQRDFVKHCSTKKHKEKVEQILTPQDSAEFRGFLREFVHKEDDNNDPHSFLGMSGDKVSYCNDSNQCQYCLKNFVRKDSIPRHMLTCYVKKERDLEQKLTIELKNKELQLELKNKELEMQLKNKEIEIISKQVEDIREDKQFQQKVIACNTKNLDGALKVSMNALTFLNKYHTDTPALENFEDDFKDPYVVYIEDDMEYDGECYIINDEFIDKDDYIVDKIITLQTNNDVVKFFAMLMIKIYKNEKYPHLQAYWANDTTRNHYSVRQKYGDDVVKWFPDKDGRIIISKVINPMLKFTVAVMRKRLSMITAEVEERKQNKDLDGIIFLVKKQEIITAFIRSVEKEEIQGDIIKKMSSAFYLDVSKQMINVKNSQNLEKTISNDKLVKFVKKN